MTGSPYDTKTAVRHGVNANAPRTDGFLFTIQSNSDNNSTTSKHSINMTSPTRERRSFRHTGLLLFTAILALLMAQPSQLIASGDGDGQGTSAAEYIPEAPDYDNPAMWFTRKDDNSGTGADVFYIVSTWISDWTTADGRTSRYADVHNAARRADMDKEISRIAEYMGKGNNFYSPYYRHISINIWLTQDEDTINNRFKLAMGDVRAAFSHFLRHRAPSRPFVLAGFSQGGKAVVELLKEMPEDVARHLVAAYVLGYKVTPADTLATRNIRAAQRADDTGVTICYNSVADVRYIKPVVSAPCAMCINPVNWRTDATPATLADTVTVSVSPEHHVLVVKGYSGAGYRPIAGLLNVGDFHSAEPWLYQDCLERNIRLRIRKYRESNYKR